MTDDSAKPINEAESDRPKPIDITTRLRQTRANMLGTDDEQHYWDCHEAAGEIERLKKIINDYALICQSSSLELRALRER